MVKGPLETAPARSTSLHMKLTEMLYLLLLWKGVIHEALKNDSRSPSVFPGSYEEVNHLKRLDKCMEEESHCAGLLEEALSDRKMGGNNGSATIKRGFYNDGNDHHISPFTSKPTSQTSIHSLYSFSLTPTLVSSLWNWTWQMANSLHSYHHHSNREIDSQKENRL